MTTINIHKDKLLPAAFAYHVASLQTWKELKNKFSENPYLCRIYDEVFDDIVKEYAKLQTACRVAEDGIVSLDIDVVQRIFGEE